MRKILFVAFFLIFATGIASAGTYTVKWVNVTSVNDTLNLNFVSTVSNATLTINSTAKVDVFPFTAATTEPAQYCIQINGNWINITNSTGYLKASFYDSNFWTYVNSTGADIRITNQSSQLCFWIQDFNATARTATIWVNLTAGSSELNICYGNPLALPNSYNNGSKTFLFFDDFTKGLVGTWTQVTGTWIDGATGLYVSTDYGSPPGNVIIYTGQNFAAGSYILYLYGKVGDKDLSAITNMQGTTASNAFDIGGQDNYGNYVFLNDWSGTAWSTTGTTSALTSATGDNFLVKYWQIGTTQYCYAKDLTSGASAETTRTVTLTSGYIGLHQSAAFTTPSIFKLLFVASLADPAQFGTPYQTQQNITVTVGTFTTTTNASTIAIPSTVFSSTTPVIIAPSGSARFNATLTFDYAYSSTSTIVDTGVYYEKKFSINTSGLTAPITLNVTFPLRTTKYAEFVNVSPATTVTNSTVNNSIITSYILQNNTTYSIDEKIGYLIAELTAKDELSSSAISSFVVVINGKTKTGSPIDIFGTDVPQGTTEEVIAFNATGYVWRHYILDTTKLNQSITLYLLADSAATMITYTITAGTTVLSNAKVVIEKTIGLNTVIIDSQYSDSSGVVAVPLHAYDTYTVIASKPGYGTVTSTITITQATYTITLSSANLAIPSTSRAVIKISPAPSTLPAGNNTITVSIVPQPNEEISSATITVKVNGTPVATVTKSAITSETDVAIPVNVSENSRVSVQVEYTQDGQTYTIQKNYTVPQATGIWATLEILNSQLGQTKGGKAIGLIIAAFIALAVVATLATTTNTTARGLGFIALAVFSIVALPLNAIGIGMLAAIWVGVIATWVIWRWI